jgi:signal transduction histidine kinase
MRLRLWPDSIFGRVLAVLIVSCALAQIVATTLVIHRGGNLIVRREYPMMGDAAMRVADILRTLASLPADERSAALRSLDGRPIDIDLAQMPVSPGTPPPPGLPPLMQLGIGYPGPLPPNDPPLSRTNELVKRIRERVGDDIDLNAEVAPIETSVIGSYQSHAARLPISLSTREKRSELDWVSAAALSPGLAAGSGKSSRVTVVRDASILLTASWPDQPAVTFRIASGATLIKRTPLGFNFLVGLQLAAQLFVVFVGVSLGAYVAARRITSPLSRLAIAADSLGRSLGQPPLPETGPRELRQVAQGFNVMQDRLRRYIDSRTRVVAAMSHDLRTPLTRARLRLEMMDDDEHRREFEQDLTEMEGMVIATLDALSDLGVEEATKDIDVNELLSRLQSEFAQLGRYLTIEGHAACSYPARPQALKRCLVNLIDNAFKYGDVAEVHVFDGEWLCIMIADRGPGIPADQLDQVFEPFYRLESSRSRETGGAGLGLSVARDCAQAHGGRLILRNGEEGGLEAELSLPRSAGSSLPSVETPPK